MYLLFAVAKPMSNQGGSDTFKRTAPKRRSGGAAMLWRLTKLVLVLVVFGFIGLAGYAYLGDLSPVQRDVTQPVTLDAE
jgi:hypothetical protein